MRPLKPGSQASQILAHLVGGNTITPMEALVRFGCLTLSQRVGELKARGHDIRSRLADVGGKTVARYWLEGTRRQKGAGRL